MTSKCIPLYETYQQNMSWYYNKLKHKKSLHQTFLHHTYHRFVSTCVFVIRGSFLASTGYILCCHTYLHASLWLVLDTIYTNVDFRDCGHTHACVYIPLPDMFPQVGWVKIYPHLHGYGSSTMKEESCYSLSLKSPFRCRGMIWNGM